MDDNFRPSSQSADPAADAGAQRINVTVGGDRPQSTAGPEPIAPSVTPPPGPLVPETPAVPESPTTLEPTAPAPTEVPASPEMPVPSEVPALPGEPVGPASPEPQPQPLQPYQPESAAPAPPPPAPGSVVTSADGSIGGPPQPVVTPKSSKGKKWLKILLVILLIAILVVAGWFVYQKVLKKKPAPAAPAKPSVTIPLLKVGILNADYGQLYPKTSLSPANYLVNSQVFEGLVRYQDKSKISPDLATAWTTTDNKTWLFTLRSGVKFHDGHTLAPSDVKYSIDTEKATNSDFAQAFAGNIASVDTVGDNQVKITTTNPDPALLNKLTFLYVIDANAPQGGDASQAGTGPYVVKSGTTPSSTSVQLTAFSGYHGGAPTTQALNFGSSTSGSDLVKAFQNGQYNIAGPVTPAQAKQANGAVKFTTVEPDINYVGFNTVKAGPLQNAQVRQAIRLALSAQSIADARGVQVTPTGQLIPQTIAGYNPSIKPAKQDVNKAKQLLQQAGFGNGFTINLSTADNQASNDELVKELKAVGITANVSQQNSVDDLVKYFNSGQADMFTVDYASDPLDGLDIYQTTLNSANYNNQQVTSLLAQAATEMDADKRQQLLQQVATQVDQDNAVAPLYNTNDVWLMDKPYVIKQDQPNASISVYFSGVKNSN